MNENFTGMFVACFRVSVAILAGGYARTRARSAWTWFLLTLIFGPLSLLLLVTWPAVERRR